MQPRADRAAGLGDRLTAQDALARLHQRHCRRARVLIERQDELFGRARGAQRLRSRALLVSIRAAVRRVLRTWPSVSRAAPAA